jgi:hypothetical protein
MDARLHYGAIGDVRHDDTHAFRKAFRDPSQPDALLCVGWETWRKRADGKGSAGNAIGSYLFDLTIDTGRGNPGAVALSFHSNNHGSIENVAIRSGDDAGHRGLDFSMNWPGPTLIKNVSVDGFDTGIYTRAGEYSLVFENLTLHGQREAAIRNEGNILSIRRLRSINHVPAIRTGGWGMVTLIDSVLEAPDGSVAPGIIDENQGALCVRNTVEIPPQIRYVLGMRNAIGRHEGWDGPTVRVSTDGEHPVIFERIRIDGLPTRPGHDPVFPAFEHVSRRTVVFRHNGPRLYQGREGAGHVFIESAEGYWRFAKGQKAWGRQMNPESHNVSELINDGADVWILGLKTEYATTKVVNRNHGRIEVLGGFLYTVTEAAPDLPMVGNQDATLSMIFSTSAYQQDHRVYFRDTQNGETLELLNHQIDSKGPRRHVHLYTSRPPGGTSP